MEKLIQQVNFYQPIFQRKKKPFGASVIAVYVGIAVAIMLITTGYGYYQLSGLQTVADQLSTQEQELKQQVESARNSLKPRRPNHLLEARKEKLSLSLGDARRLSRLLDQAVSQEQPQYSAYFRGLAESTINGLWLDSLMIANGGEALRLSGRTLKPELVPRLLQNLQGKTIFDGHSFDNVRLLREQKEGVENSVQFFLDTTVDEEIADAG